MLFTMADWGAVEHAAINPNASKTVPTMRNIPIDFMDDLTDWKSTFQAEVTSPTFIEPGATMFLMRICALLLAVVALCAAADAPTTFTGNDRRRHV